MKYATLNTDTYALRLERSEDVHDVIQQFCLDHAINNASIEGLGSIESPTLAHYRIDSKQFTDNHFDGIFEVTALLSNIALVDGQPFAHIHVTIADNQMQTFGGHLVKGDCSATLELIIHAYPTSYTKSHADEVGLKVWDF